MEPIAPNEAPKNNPTATPSTASTATGDTPAHVPFLLDVTLRSQQLHKILTAWTKLSALELIGGRMRPGRKKGCSGWMQTPGDKALSHSCLGFPHYPFKGTL